jgi:hypothetical protein
MYGLLSKAYSEYKIKNTTGREGYNIKNYIHPKNGIYLVIEYFFTILALLALIDCSMIFTWSLPIVTGLLALFFIPAIGDILAFGLIVYWLIYAKDKSVLIKR